MIPLFNIGMKCIKVTGRKNYTAEIEVMVMPQTEESRENRQERLDLARVSFYTALFWEEEN